MQGVFLDDSEKYNEKNTHITVLKSEHNSLSESFKSKNNELNQFLVKDALGYQNLIIH